MGVKLTFTIIVSKLILIACKLFRWGGTNLPGKIALKIFPDILTELSKNYKIIMITGTNGKTTTARIIGSILLENKIEYISNKSGANLMGGIVTTFIKGSDIYGNNKVSTSIIEVDEGIFHILCTFMEPDFLVVTNFFRDQLDRYGELHNTIKSIMNTIEKTKSTKLILNADDSLCASLGRGREGNTIYYSIAKEASITNQENISSDAVLCFYCKSRYIYSYHTYGHLGGFACPECGYTHPDSQINCNYIYELNSGDSSIQLSFKESSEENKEKSEFNIKTRVNLPGIYNIYNSLAGAACGHALALPPENTVKALGNFESGFGRIERISIDGKTILITLVKNPSGFNQVLDLLETQDQMQISFIINDLPGDGADISWLWDVNFEKLQTIQDNISNIYTSGTRAEEISVRLKYAGIYTDKISMVKDYDSLIKLGLSRTKDNGTFYIYPNYTAMLAIRKSLKKKYILKEF